MKSNDFTDMRIYSPINKYLNIYCLDTGKGAKMCKIAPALKEFIKDPVIKVSFHFFESSPKSLPILLCIISQTLYSCSLFIIQPLKMLVCCGIPNTALSILRRIFFRACFKISMKAKPFLHRPLCSHRCTHG